jgi:hypothetical protein
MHFIWQRSRMLAITAVFLVGAGAATAGRSHAISDPILGAEWQCSRTAFVVTCSHLPR